jgi:sulfur carrier protein
LGLSNILHLRKTTIYFMSKIKIFLNGEEKVLEREMSILDLISTLELDSKKIAIEKDLEIIHQNQFAKTMLENGSKIEIVHFIGGG